MNNETAWVDPARLDANWRAITAELDAPRPSRLERAMRLVGVPATTTRLVLATPALRRSWYLAVGFAAFLGLVAADSASPRQSLLTLLVVAPLLPVLGVSMAYGPSADPSYEISVATPLSGLHLLLTRALTVLIASITVIGGLSLISNTARPMAAAWLLPATALTACTMAAMTVLSPRRAAAAVATTWLFVVLFVRAASSDPLGAFTMPGQVSALIVAVAAAVVVYLRRSSLDVLRGEA